MSQNLKSEGHLLNGKEEGVWIYWYLNGQQSAEGLYVNGLKDGLWILWYENGQKFMECHYTKGQKSGTWTIWDEKGNKDSEVLYINSSCDAPKRFCAEWYANGQIRRTAEFIDTKLVTEEQWDESGNKMAP